MPVHNVEIVRALNEIADLLEIGEANPFRVRAYRNAARTVESLPREVTDMLEAGEKLEDLRGIGEDLAAKIADSARTGTTRMLDELHRDVPAPVGELLKLPGLGPKRVHALWHDLGVQTLDQLARAARDGRVRALPGFGAKMEKKLLEAVAARAGTEQRMKLANAAVFADALTGYLEDVPGVGQVTVAGSFRRGRETVGDLDILVTAKKSSPVMDRFVAFDEVEKVVSKGSTRATVVLRAGLQVDLRVVPARSYGAALYYFTGSKAHNIAVRRLGQRRGLKINEYGVFKGKTRVAGDTEESVFKAVGLKWIAPELRENRGEIEAARKGKLPKLVELADLKGDLHAHTKATDGHNTLREMALAARDRGFEYVAITEHSKHLTVAHGLDARRLMRQADQIDSFNEQGHGITVLKGIEVDILEDGRLDLPDHVLARLDLVVAAVHSAFGLSRAKQTARILGAMDRPHLTILAHPSGRLIGEREPYDVDMERIIRAARARPCYLELNAHPERLDLLDSYCRMAKDEGVLVSVNSDSHRTDGFDNLRFGINQARRGWLEAKDVLNTRPFEALRDLLKRTM
jgi:DNA polymerase (family 10)